ncbi:MAG: alpha/beta hydrolase [Alphaproteobacteria bacterium]|nr:alpha/beta hydrolase [Alphaproteobacteria bacterium]
MGSGNNFRELSFRVRDGLRLYARHYPAPGSTKTPVLCLAGLTRNSRDFHDVASYLSQGPNARAVYTLDYRGRGKSDWDRNWKNYAVPVEALDVIDFLTFAELKEVAILGTSRGGLVTMVMAAIQPSTISMVVLNDIGPVIERDGLMRIASYVGRIPLPRDWEEAATVTRDVNQRSFPGVEDSVWEECARQWYNEKRGRLAPGYDPLLKNALSVLDGPVPELWGQFEALKRVPVLVVRGGNSDLLSDQTIDRMAERHSRLQRFTVPGQGHAPLMKDRATQEAIGMFFENAEGSHHAVAAE